MNPEFQSWRRSSHAKVACSSCHTDDSFSSAVADKVIIGPRMIAKEITGHYSRPINSRSRYSQKKVPVERCLRCHSPKNRFFSVRLGLKMDHPAHLRAGLRCTTCHNRIAHPGAETHGPLSEKNKGFKYPDYLTMRQGCWRCHREGGKFVDPRGKKHTGPFVAKTGQKAPTTCYTCHMTTWTELPTYHKPARGVKWGRGLAHGEVARRDFKQCKGCHEPAVWCSTRCHFGVTMPHVENWVQLHPARAKGDIKRCFACHKAKAELDFCGKRCHHAPFQKQYKLPKEFAWSEGKEQHGVAVKATGGKPCFRCHDQATWCATKCHQGVTMPHVAGWQSVHFKYVEFVPGDGWQRDKAVCRMCHNKSGPSYDNYCFTCHHKRYEANGPMPLMKWLYTQYGARFSLRSDTRLPCEDCHAHKGLTFCRDCHDGKAVRKNVFPF